MKIVATNKKTRKKLIAEYKKDDPRAMKSRGWSFRPFSLFAYAAELIEEGNTKSSRLMLGGTYIQSLDLDGEPHEAFAWVEYVMEYFIMQKRSGLDNYEIEKFDEPDDPDLQENEDDEDIVY